jgi:O-acetyl-ADP-ribose deacetylase (regulator of RNase III)
LTRLGGTDLGFVVADITALKVDAIANGANAALELYGLL